MRYLYVEEPLLDHPKTRAIHKSTGATLIPIQRYGEVFNRHRGNFRLQKKQSALILAEKKGKLVYNIPPTVSDKTPHLDHSNTFPLGCLISAPICIF